MHGGDGDCRCGPFLAGGIAERHPAGWLKRLWLPRDDVGADSQAASGDFRPHLVERHDCCARRPLG
jgi:hypothetical protein